MRYLFGDVKSILKFSAFCVCCALFVCCLVFLSSCELPVLMANGWLNFTAGFFSCLTVNLFCAIVSYIVETVRYLIVIKRLSRCINGGK